MDAAPGGFLRAANRGADLAVGQVACEAQGDRGSLLRRQPCDSPPDAGLTVRLRSRCDFRRVGHRDRAPLAGPVIVDRFAVGDRQQPAAQISVVIELRVGPQRRQERLLKAVLGVVRPHGRDQKAEDVALVALEQLLKGRQSLHPPIKRGRPRKREIASRG